MQQEPTTHGWIGVMIIGIIAAAFEKHILLGLLVTPLILGVALLLVLRAC